jgi:hypothetical protein
VVSSDAVRLLTEVGSLQMTDSFNEIKEIAVASGGIPQTLEDPQLFNNIDNIYLAFDTMRDSLGSLTHVLVQLRESGIVEETTNAGRAPKERIYINYP